MKDNTIYYLDDETISNQAIIEEHIYPNMDLNYYWSDDFSPSFYAKLARAGFISTSMFDMQERLILLPEIQFEYAVLEFNNLHISKKVKSLIKANNHTFKLNSDFHHVLDKLETYHTPSWLIEEYKQTLIELFNNPVENVELMSVELWHNDKLISGEVGYKIGKTYTSLTGFTTREKQYNNWGKLQLVLLAQYLEKEGFDFWNLGHASLQYKIDLGADVLPRDAFLDKWKKSIIK